MFIHILYCTIMFLESTMRQKAVLFHRKAFSNCMDEAEYNHRNYLILLSHFSDNLNASIKHLETCIPDLEEHPKFKISRTERELLNCSLQYLSEQYLDRLCRESYYRNAIIRRNYHLFLDSYSSFYSKVQRKDYPRVKSFNCRSFSQKQRKPQRTSLNYQGSQKLQSFSSKKETKQSAGITKPTTFELNVSTSLQKHNFEGSKVLSSKKTGIRMNQSKQLTKSSTQDRKNGQFEVKGDFVIVSQCKFQGQQESWQLEKTVKNPVQRFSTNRVLAFRNRISTNPQQQQRSRTVKQNTMLRMSYLKVQNSINRSKVIKTFQQQIKMIVNIDV